MARDRVRDQAVGSVLRRLREAGASGEAMTQREVALAIGLTGPGGPVSISRFESGAVHVPAGRLSALAELFGTTSGQINEEASALAAQVPEDARPGATPLSERVRTALGGGGTAQDNYLRKMAIEQEVADRRARTESLLERLHDSQQELLDGVLKPYLEQAARLKLPIPPGTLQDGDGPQSDTTDEARLEATKGLLRQQIQGSVRGADVGALAAVGASAAVFAWLAASAEASAKVAAASSPGGAVAGGTTLAWLGSGPLVAGGLGFAGGSLVMGSIVMLPALIAAGGVVAYHSHHLRQQAAEESERLDLAEAELGATGLRLDSTWRTISRARSVIDGITTLGLREVRWLARESGAVSSGDERPSIDRARVEALSELIVTATAVLGLPILRDLQPDAIDDPERDERTRWNDFVLDHAAAQMETYPRFLDG
jgi:transcriptional regulator with XRE-family HTH domain